MDLNTKETILPIKEYEQQILERIKANQVTIICGETGCGKTTQVPQYIIKNIPNSKVIVTQPRRIAAISVATRVADQLNTKLGGVVGYHIGMDNQVSNTTQISYVTTGILLQKLINDPKFLDTYTHIIFDEVHQRGIECDFSLIAIKLNLCQQARNNLKIIVMSATLNSNLFSNFFAQTPDGSFIKSTVDISSKKKRPRRGDRRDRNSQSEEQQLQYSSRLVINKTDKPAHCVILPTLRKYNIQIKYIDDVFENASSHGTYPYFDDALVNKSLKICQQNLHMGDILIFVPGMRQIKMVSNAISAKKLDCKIFQLHSHFNTSVSQLFGKSQIPKIIISTNIAQSSITLPQIKTVIDFCMSKQSQYNQQTNFQRLQLCFASQASMIQRAGRVGRVSDGVVYRLILKQQFEDANEYDESQMRRNSLQKTILRIKKLDSLAIQSQIRIFKDVFEVLSNAFEAPDTQKINKTLQKLVFQGALIVQSQQQSQYSSLKYFGLSLLITELGKYAVEMPCDIHLSKMLILASTLGVHEQMIDIVAIMNYKKAFFVPYQKRVRPQRYVHTLIEYDDNSFSDFNSKQKIFDDWLMKYFFPWKKQNYQKFEIKQQQKEEAKDDQELSFEKYRGIYIDNSKLINSFIADKVPASQIQWCTKRCVFANNFRQILSLRESIANKVNRKLKIYQPSMDYSYEIQNILQTVSLFAGFKDNLIEILLQKKSMYKIQTEDDKDINITLLLSKFDGQQKQLSQFILSSQFKEEDLKIVRSNNNYFVTGSLKYLSKLKLPFRTRKTAVPKTSSKVFNYLSSNNPIYEYQFSLREKRNYKNVTLDDDSINKAQFYCGYFQGYLLTDQFKQTTVGLIAKSTSWISSQQATLLLLVLSKQLKLVYNKTQQFYNGILVGKTQYNLPFFITNQLLQMIKSLRKTILKLFSINQKQVIDNQLIISSLTYLLNRCQLVKPIPIVEMWEERYALQKNKNILKPKYSDQFDNIQSVPLVPQNYYKDYKKWKHEVIIDLQNSIDELKYDKVIFICKQCLPNERSIVCTMSNVNQERKIFIQKQSTSEWIENGNKMYCRGKAGHYLGQIEGNVPLINCKQKLMLRYPNGVLVSTSLQSIDYKSLEEQQNKMKKEVKVKQTEDRTYECKICYDQGYEYTEESYQKFKKHYMSSEHRNREKRFKVFY